MCRRSARDSTGGRSILGTHIFQFRLLDWHCPIGGGMAVSVTDRPCQVDIRNWTSLDGNLLRVSYFSPLCFIIEEFFFWQFFGSVTDHFSPDSNSSSSRSSDSSCTGGTMQLLTYLWFHIGDGRPRQRWWCCCCCWWWWWCGDVVIVDWDRSLSELRWHYGKATGIYGACWANFEKIDNIVTNIIVAGFLWSILGTKVIAQFMSKREECAHFSMS